jgi:hypothetical protein
MRITRKRPLIYGLIDPRNGQLRYIGKSENGLKRAQDPHSPRCGNWLKQLKKLGLNVEIEILEELPNASHEILNEAEVFWIGYFKMVGVNLTNLTSGGDGVRGIPLHLDHRLKISRALKGRPSPRKGAKLSKETRRAMSEAHKGLKFSDDHRASISRSNQGRISVWKGKTIPTEVKKKMSIARREYWRRKKNVR